MSQRVTISDQLHTELEATARARGFDSIERLLEYYQANDDELRRRQQVGQEIQQLREHLSAKYGRMPDSVSLIREDRDR
jgi:hypothetical protein